MTSLSLHHLVALDLSPAELVKLAGELGCDHVCLITQAPADATRLPAVGDEDVEGLRRLMDESGLTAHSVTSFPLLPDTDIGAYRAGLARGARLGATRANARVLDPDSGRAAETFAAFGALCGEFGILPCIEFYGFEDRAALSRAAGTIRAAGCGALTLDSLHVARTGTAWDELQALDPALIGYVQLCDGPLAATAEDYAREGPYDRLAPGDGELPLRDFLSLIPSSLPLSLEVPCQRLREAGYGPTEAAKYIVERTRAFLGEGPAAA